MSKFTFMGFGYDGGRDEMFVAHAKKYTPAETVALCLRECEPRFLASSCFGPTLRKPEVSDVTSGDCAFRFGVSVEWPEGCYTFVCEDEPGAFPVWVINFKDLRQEAAP